MGDERIPYLEGKFKMYNHKYLLKDYLKEQKYKSNQQKTIEKDRK